jgi:Na+/melibiose symporter-like transporter
MLNGATFVVSAISLFFAQPLIRQVLSKGTSYREQILSSMAYLWNDRVLRYTTAALFSANLVVGFIEPTLIPVSIEVLGLTTDAEIQWVFLAFSVGGLIGAFSATAMIRRFDIGRTFAIGFAMAAIGLAGLVSGQSLTFVLVSIAFGFVGLPWLNVAAVTIRQIRSPDEMLGRITAASRAISLGSLPIGAVVGGYLADEVLSLSTVLIAGPALLGVTALWLRISPVWAIRREK